MAPGIVSAALHTLALELEQGTAFQGREMMSPGAFVNALPAEVPVSMQFGTRIGTARIETGIDGITFHMTLGNDGKWRPPPQGEDPPTDDDDWPYE
jgi:hypothetical protein